MICSKMKVGKIYSNKSGCYIVLRFGDDYAQVSVSSREMKRNKVSRSAVNLFMEKLLNLQLTIKLIQNKEI